MILNQEQACEMKSKVYPTNKDYDVNSIACEIAMDKMNDNKIKNNFCGQMSALYFVEASHKNYASFHSVLKAIYSSNNFIFSDFANLFANLSQQLGISGLLDKMFLIVNPKWARKPLDPAEAVYVLQQKGKQELFNQVQQILPYTTIHNNSQARTTFPNIDGIISLLPLLFEIGDHSFLSSHSSIS